MQWTPPGKRLPGGPIRRLASGDWDSQSPFRFGIEQEAPPVEQMRAEVEQRAAAGGTAPSQSRAE